MFVLTNPCKTEHGYKEKVYGCTLPCVVSHTVCKITTQKVYHCQMCATILGNCCGAKIKYNKAHGVNPQKEKEHTI